ncbi:MAG: 3-methyl-2-oxobutanoate hydroxymethyltransferase [Pseudanabaenaceae cyanobacterium]|jgi:3-methyl-2-oxobutanoate hydroxymethyltransferase
MANTATVTIPQLATWKSQGRKISALTATDYGFARLLDQAGVDLILVGDSLGMVALGYRNTLPLTLDEMIHHAKAVCRGVNHACVVVDLPFLTYQASTEQAMLSAGRILKETDAQAVKLEGGYPAMAATIERLVQAGIPVMGHLGLTPQSVHQLGYRPQGKTSVVAERIMQEAHALVNAGVFAIVLEHMPEALAAEITAAIPVPTIGIGAGHGCDGQILVTHDLLGLSAWQPSFAPPMVNLSQTITEAVSTYCERVRNSNG